MTIREFGSKVGAKKGQRERERPLVVASLFELKDERRRNINGIAIELVPEHWNEVVAGGLIFEFEAALNWLICGSRFKFISLILKVL